MQSSEVCSLSGTHTDTFILFAEARNVAMIQDALKLSLFNPLQAYISAEMIRIRGDLGIDDFTTMVDAYKYSDLIPNITALKVAAHRAQRAGVPLDIVQQTLSEVYGDEEY